jgi:hypothetical protein
MESNHHSLVITTNLVCFYLFQTIWRVQGKSVCFFKSKAMQCNVGCGSGVGVKFAVFILSGK